VHERSSRPQRDSQHTAQPLPGPRAGVRGEGDCTCCVFCRVSGVSPQREPRRLWRLCGLSAAHPPTPSSAAAGDCCWRAPAPARVSRVLPRAATGCARGTAVLLRRHQLPQRSSTLSHTHSTHSASSAGATRAARVSYRRVHAASAVVVPVIEDGKIVTRRVCRHPGVCPHAASFPPLHPSSIHWSVPQGPRIHRAAVYVHVVHWA
jgi:hypothetical protein